MAKRVPPLTASGIAKIKPDQATTIELVDGAVPGLRLRVTPKNTRTWSLNIRANGVMRRFDVGANLGLAEARDKAEKIRRSVKEGADPTAERRARRNEAVSAKLGIGTFEAVLDEYFASGRGGSLKTKAEQQLRLKSVFRSLLTRPAMAVSSVELQRAVDAYAARVSAARAVGYVAPAIKWAVKRGVMQGTFDLEKPIMDAPKQRVLAKEELGRLLPTLDDSYGRCCLLMLYTGARREEACGARWGHFDLQSGLWTIPGDDRKDTRGQVRRRAAPKRDMVIPLSRQARALIEEAGSAEIHRRDLEAVSADIAPHDLVFVGRRGKRLTNWNRWVKANIERSGVKGWSPHALRRTTATMAGDLGAPPHIVSIILGHANVGGQLVAGYNKSRYTIEQGEYLQKLADEIDLIGGEGRRSGGNLRQNSR